jgi:hypothetical protein
MTGQERDFEELLSRVLHSTTDQIEPLGDGLTKIQVRLTEPWLKRQWWLLRSEFMVLRWLVVVRCESFLATVRSGSAAAAGAGESPVPLHRGGAGLAGGVADQGGWPRWLRPVLGPVMAWAPAKRLGKASAPLRRSVGPAMAWLRPALAVAGAVVLVVGGVFALGQMRGAFVGLENATGTDTTNSSHGNSSGNPNGGGSVLPGSNPGTPTAGRSSSAKRGATTHSKAAPSPTNCSSPSTPPINSPSPSPSPTPDPTPDPTPTTTSPSPTPDPSTSITSGPLAMGMAAGDQSEAITTDAMLVCPPAPPASPTNQATSGS